MGLLHDIGQIGGHVLNAAPGYSTLGANITNPDINYQGVLNPPTPANNYLDNPQGQVAKNTTPTTPTAVLGASTTAADPQAAIQAQQNAQAIQIAQSGLDQIPNSLNIALGNVQKQYDQSKQSLDQDVQNATAQYGTDQTSNQQQYRTGENQVNQSASQDKQSLLRLLAGMGAGGGSEAQYLIPQLVGQQAAKGLAGAASTYADNGKTLSTNYGNFQNQEKQQEVGLENYLSQGQQQARSTADTQKSSLLQTLAGLQTNPANAQSYIDQITALQPQINQLQSFNPQYTGSLPTYQAPALSTFQPAGAQASQATVQQNAQGGTPSLLSLLAGQQKDKTGILG